MDYEEEGFFGSGHRHYDNFYDDDDDIYPESFHHKERHCHRCGCHEHRRQHGCRCDCHSHHHHHGARRCRCGCESHSRPDRWCDCDCHGYHGGKRPYHVCRELAMILRHQKSPKRPRKCGCEASIQKLTGSHRNIIIPFVLLTRRNRLFVEWGRQRHRSYATVFFSVVKVNCRQNEAVLELLKPNKPITNPRTGRVEKRKIREVDYVVPTGERVYVDLTPIKEVKRLQEDFVKRYRL